MKIIFTGASSFTGCWFAHELVRRGHQVACTFQAASANAYEGNRARRVASLLESPGIQPIWAVSFGDPAFIELCRKQTFDILCHHASDVRGYKSADFNWAAAVAANTRGATEVFGALGKAECRAIVYTGSYFEPDEGAGKSNSEAVSPYGLSKGLSATALRYFSAREGLGWRKFVMPTPVGPGEDDRFLSFLINSWRCGPSATVRTGRYIRDHVPIKMLARCYADLVERIANNREIFVVRPSGWIEPVGEFACRVARGVRESLGCPCEVIEPEQTDFSEPPVRYNSEALLEAWSEEQDLRFWQEVAEFYTIGKFDPRLALHEN
jgi:nucleoside-diphosphate-sugar epimerase